VVELYIPQKEQTLRAHVQWRHGVELGLAFPDAATGHAPGAAPEGGELALRVAKLEAEVTTLKRMLKQMKSELPSSAREEAA
jgi:hypothetical protein